MGNGRPFLCLFCLVLLLTKSCPRVRGKWHGEAMTKGEYQKAAKLFYTIPPQSVHCRSQTERWLEYGRLAALPLAILPIPPDSPLAASPTGRARLESPASGGAFWHFTSLHIKPALKGEVGFAQAKAGGVEKESRFARYRQPLSLTSFDSSPSGEPFYALHNLSRSHAFGVFHIAKQYFTARKRNFTLR